MFKYKNLLLTLIAVSLIISCSKQLVPIRENKDYIPYSEFLRLKEVDISHVSLRSVINDFIQDLVIFENGVNYYSPYPIDYFASVESFCRNDSSFVVLKASAGSYLFYGFSDELDKRKLEQFRIASIENGQTLIAKDIEPSLCNDIKEYIYTESMKETEFRLNWYKKSNGERLIDFHPYFYKIYYLDGDKIKEVEINFHNLIQELR